MKSKTEIWDLVCETDPSITSHVKKSGGLTAIDAMHQLKRATEIFGPVGKGWSYHAEHDVIDMQEQGLLAVCDLSFSWIEPGDDEAHVFGPIRTTAKLLYKSSTGRIMVDEDAPKKALTDGLTKALSQLGFNADVFMGLFDDNRYVQEMSEKFAIGTMKNGKTVDPGVTTHALVNRYLDAVRKGIADDDELATMQLITELREEDEEAWPQLWQHLDQHDRQIVREWSKSATKTS